MHIQLKPLFVLVTLVSLLSWLCYAGPRLLYAQFDLIHGYDSRLQTRYPVFVNTTTTLNTLFTTGLLTETVAPARTLDPTGADNSKPPFVSTGQRMYLFNALCVHCELDMPKLSYKVPNEKALLKPVDNLLSPYTSISGWQHMSLPNKAFLCCYIIRIHEKESVITVKSSVFNFHKNIAGELFGKHFMCPVPIQPILIKGVTIVINGVCPSNTEVYIKATFIPRRTPETDFAICAKLAYGNVSASHLVEWFEVHKLLGVSKVIVYVYKPINDEAMKVLKMYSDDDIADLHPFDIPEKSSLKREGGFADKQGWSDEQVALYDCQERLRQFKYVAVIDTDEYMIPETTTFKNAWITYLDQVFSSEKIAGVEFLTKVHATDWGRTENSSVLFIGQYGNSTGPIQDIMKNIYMPSRVKVGSVVTDGLTPAFGHVRYRAKSDEASIHHYRRCGPNWLLPDIPKHLDKIHPECLTTLKSGTICENFKRYPSDITKRLAESVSDAVRQVWKKLDINFVNITDL